MTQRELVLDSSGTQQDSADFDQGWRLFFSDLRLWRGYEHLKQERKHAADLARLDAMVLQVRTGIEQ